MDAARSFFGICSVMCWSNPWGLCIFFVLKGNARYGWPRYKEDVCATEMSISESAVCFSRCSYIPKMSVLQTFVLKRSQYQANVCIIDCIRKLCKLLVCHYKNSVGVRVTKISVLWSLCFYEESIEKRIWTMITEIAQEKVMDIFYKICLREMSVLERCFCQIEMSALSIKETIMSNSCFRDPCDREMSLLAWCRYWRDTVLDMSVVMRRI